MTRLKQEIWFLASKRISEKRVMMTQIEYVAHVLCTSEKTVQRRFDDLAFDKNQWKMLVNEFGDAVFTAFQDTIRAEGK